jgi:tetratricopeptide (TPR) repeat protein
MTQRPQHLDRDATHAAGTAVDEHSLSRLKTHQRKEIQPSREQGFGKTRRTDEVEAARAIERKGCEFEKGISEIQKGLEKERGTGALLYESYTLGLMADACLKNERYRQAFEFLHQAQLRLKQEDAERFYAAEIYRLLGETYLRSREDLDLAEHYLQEGLKIAREQKAKSLELKLCVSIYDLYELRRSADKRRSQLSEIYASFSEGFDTTDLLRAKARLQIFDLKKVLN